MSVSVADLLRAKGNEVWSISPNSSVYGALQVLAEKNIGALLVLRGEKLVGIFSERDYARKLVLCGKFSKDTRVRQVMTRDVITISPEDEIGRCMRLMSDKRIRHLPVVKSGRVVGLISIGDIVKAIIADQRSTIHLLEEYIQGSPRSPGRLSGA